MILDHNASSLLSSTTFIFIPSPPILLPFKSVLHIFMVLPPLCLTLPLQNSLSPLLASFPPPHFSIIIYPCWPVNLSDPWLPKSPQCIPHQTLTACRHDPLLDTQWVDSHLHSLNQTASELQLVEGEGGAHSPSWQHPEGTGSWCWTVHVHTHTASKRHTHTHTLEDNSREPFTTSLWICSCEFVTLQPLFSKEDKKKLRLESVIVDTSV